MNTDTRTQLSIQILATKDAAGPVGHALAVVRERERDFAAIGRQQGAEALLVCPAPEGLSSDGIDVVVAARFGHELDEDAVFWRQRDLTREIRHALRVKALVFDLDAPLGDFLKHMEPILATPYRDEIGPRGGGDGPGV
jgi:hypothetical protein